ncbi:MAG: histidinol dehydrogenase [Candidatus Bathyarchaeia archaeon]
MELKVKEVRGLPVIPIYRLDEIPEAKLEQLKRRSLMEISEISDKVMEIIDQVRRRGDEALKEYTLRFDGAEIKDLKVKDEEFERAKERLPSKVRGFLIHAARNIRRFHEAQRPCSSWFMEVDDGVILGQIATPIHSVGLYVPGGRGSFPSTALMAVIPAQVAGVEEIHICTPPKPDGEVDDATLVAADMLGVRNVYKVGGAQAIAAMAFGTQTIPRVDKIVGPGGIWIAAAKKLASIYSNVEIEFIAGPSENLILADESADPIYVAADLLIEPEHGSDSAGIVVTTSMRLAEEVQREVEKLIGELPDQPIPRRRFAVEALGKYGAIIVCKDMDEAISFVNEYSVEHLEIIAEDPFHILKRVRNAGSIYLGEYSPSSVGCYAAGVNHILPTGQGARVHSSLSVDHFMKKTDFTFLDRKGLRSLRETVTGLAEYEGFPQHGKAVELRFRGT